MVVYPPLPLPNQTESIWQAAMIRARARVIINCIMVNPPPDFALYYIIVLFCLHLKLISD